MLTNVLWVIGAYLYGSVPVVYLIGRLRGVDLSHEEDMHISLWREVDEFFHDERGVRVMADDPGLRDNRLGLLFRLDALLRRVADFKILAALA